MASVRIVEVGPRDGLQNIPDQIPTNVKIELIQKLFDAGSQTIEITSIVSPKAIPQLKDSKDVLSSPPIKALLQQKSVRLPVLVPNVKGVEIAHKHGVSEVAVFISATEGFSKANINCTVDEGIKRAIGVAQYAHDHGMVVRGYVSCIFADPFDGPTPPAAVLHAVKALLDMGCYEVSLGDTLGVGTPANVRSLIEFLVQNGVPLDRLAGHFHDTYGQAVANAWEAYNCGIRVFDSSVAGLGGCPFAPGAKGNAATEDIVYMFENAGVQTNVNLAELAAIGEWISTKLSGSVQSRAGAALMSKKRLSKTGGKPVGKAGSRLAWELVKETDALLLHRAGANLKVTMNRPRKGNALTVSMIADLISIFSEAAQDPSVNRIALTGSGKFFCSGMDLGKGDTPVGAGDSASDAQFNRLSRLFETIDKSPKVTIACLNGPAFGGGVGLAFSCDLRFFARGATVTLSETRLGLCPATISKYIIREWGIPFARESMLLARPVSPEELRSKGIIAAVADDAGQLEGLLDNYLTQVRGVSSEACRMSKDLVKAGWMHAGNENQEAIIKQLFDEMMKPDAPGSFGVKEFQAGRRVDWDKYSSLKSRSKL